MKWEGFQPYKSEKSKVANNYFIINQMDECFNSGFLEKEGIASTPLISKHL